MAQSALVSASGICSGWSTSVKSMFCTSVKSKAGWDVGLAREQVCLEDEKGNGVLWQGSKSFPKLLWGC